MVCSLITRLCCFFSIKYSESLEPLLKEVLASSSVQHGEEDCICICETRSTGSRCFEIFTCF